MSNLLDAAAVAYLSGDTQEANRLIADARSADANYFAEHSTATKALHAELEAAIANETVERFEENDRYTDEHVRTYWKSARDEFENRSPRENANSLVYHTILRKFGGVVDAMRPSTVLDFGCACGLPLAKLASRFCNTHFVGVDRQSTLRRLNQEHFAAQNLTFLDGSVFDALPVAPGADKLLMHVRTGIMLYPAFLDRLYAEAFGAGYRYVALYEIASVSCVSWTFRDQGSGFKSEAHRSTMFLHDYASALRRAGYNPLLIERMPHGYALDRNNMLPGDTYVFVLAKRD